MLRHIPLALATCLLLTIADVSADDHSDSLEVSVEAEEVPKRYQKKIQGCLDGYTIKEPLPHHDFEADRETFEFLLNELPMSSRIVKVLELGRYDISKVGRDAIDIDDGEGALVRLRPIVDQSGERIFYGRGRLKASNLPEVTGEGIVAVVWQSAEDGTLKVRAQIWFKLDDRFLHLVTQVFKEALGSVAGGRAAAVVDTAVTVTKAVQEDAAGVFEKMEQSGKFSERELELFRTQFLVE